jgi:hypothetical protein
MGASDVGVRLADRRGSNADQDLAGAWLRSLDLLDMNDVRRSIPILYDGPHVTQRMGGRFAVNAWRFDGVDPELLGAALA